MTTCDAPVQTQNQLPAAMVPENSFETTLQKVAIAQLKQNTSAGDRGPKELML